MPDWQLEQVPWRQGYARVAGVDEAGRGALAGPVVAAAVVLPYADYPYNDSKQLSASQRTSYAQLIQAQALAWGIGLASAKEIDQLNVLQATHLAAMRALEAMSAQGMSAAPDALVTDYLKLEGVAVLAVAKADRLSVQVAAASILAKTFRDGLMLKLAQAYPGYGFAQHKGYPTSAHRQALGRHGPCEQHRLSFKPVAQQALFG
jgi:ribonuclease HII